MCLHLPLTLVVTFGQIRGLLRAGNGDDGVAHFLRVSAARALAQPHVKAAEPALSLDEKGKLVLVATP